MDRDLISSHPKWVMGYSDCTNLHLFLWNLGMQSCYGGALMTQWGRSGGMDSYTLDSIEKALFSPCLGEIKEASEWSDYDLDWADPENLKRKPPMYQGKGWDWHQPSLTKIEGILWGGCLEVLEMHLAFKKYLPSMEQLKNCVLFVETSEEMPTDGFVYRFFAMLGELNMLNHFKAILMGYPKAQFCDKLPPEGKEQYRILQREAVKNVLKDYNAAIPIVFNMNFGHMYSNNLKNGF